MVFPSQWSLTTNTWSCCSSSWTLRWRSSRTLKMEIFFCWVHWMQFKLKTANVIYVYIYTILCNIHSIYIMYIYIYYVYSKYTYINVYIYMQWYCIIGITPVQTHQIWFIFPAPGYPHHGTRPRVRRCWPCRMPCTRPPRPSNPPPGWLHGWWRSSCRGWKVRMGTLWLNVNMK